MSDPPTIAAGMTIPELRWLRRILNAGGRHFHHLTWCEERLEQKGLIKMWSFRSYSATVLGRRVLDAAEQAWRERGKRWHPRTPWRPLAQNPHSDGV